MKKRYIILHGTTTPEQREALLQYFKDQRFGWWSWLGDSWLISDVRGISSTAEIRDKLVELMPGVHNLVLELSATGDTWTGYGPSEEKRNMFKWIKDNWKRS